MTRESRWQNGLWHLATDDVRGGCPARDLGLFSMITYLPDSPRAVISAATVPRQSTFVLPTSVAFTTKPAAHGRIYPWLKSKNHCGNFFI